MEQIHHELQLCKLCGSPARFLFSKALTRGIKANFFECSKCELLQSRHLDALTEEGLQQIYSGSSKLDTGSAWRQFCVCLRLEYFSRTGIVVKDQPVRALDFGGGTGFCSAFMRHRLGWDAFVYDAFEQPSYNRDHHFVDFASVEKKAPYNLILASEVFEHLRDPQVEIARLVGLLNPNGGCLYLTTGRYRPGIHGADWDYLVPQSAQHVAFYSKKSMQYVASLFGASICENVVGDFEWILARKSKSMAQTIKRKTAVFALQSADTLGWVKRIL